MDETRIFHTATLLSNGTVLVTGGPSNTAEIYNPQTGTWRYTLNPMNVARSYHTAVELLDGSVLVAGGTSTPTVAEIFDPIAETFTPTTAMNATHASSPGILLNDGRVLIITGSLTAGASEIYDAVANSWTVTASIPVGAAHMAGLGLPSGASFASGGNEGSSVDAYPYVELYNASSDSVQTMANMVVSRIDHRVTLLPDGTILITGGSDSSYSLSSTEIYNVNTPPNGQSQLSTSLSQARRDPTAALLPNGDVLVIGGYQARPGGPVDAYLATAELRDYATAAWSLAGTMSTPRDGQTATLLPSGAVLVAGGGPGTATNTAELWSFSTTLTFPLKSYSKMTKASQDKHLTAATAQVNTVFDHSMLSRGKYHIYGCDQTVIAYDGITATKYNRDVVLHGGCDNSGYSPNATLTPLGPTGPQPYTVLLNPSMTYHGGGNDVAAQEHLYYDGHPGIDYHAAMQTQVYAAVSGNIHYPNTIVGLGYPGADFNVMAVIPDHATEAQPPYMIYYLHLYTYPSASCPSSGCTGPNQPAGSLATLDPDPRTGCQGTPAAGGGITVNLPLPEGTPVQAGCLVALSGDTAPYSLHAHLHFEVQQIVPRSTVSNAYGAQTATKCIDSAIPSTLNCVPVDSYGWCTLTQCPSTSVDPYFSITGITSVPLWQ